MIKSILIRVCLPVESVAHLDGDEHGQSHGHRVRRLEHFTIQTLKVRVISRALQEVALYLKKSHPEMSASLALRGGFSMMSRSGGLKPSAVAGRPSVTRFTQSSCTGIRASGKPSAAVRKMLREKGGGTLSSARTISEADLATAVPEPIAIPISAFFRAGASISTILLLCDGSTRAKHRALVTASTCSAGDSSSNSRPVNANASTSSSSPKMPMRRQMATAVPLLSPVIMMTRIPACRHSLMDAATSSRGGSSMPTQPTKVRSDWRGKREGEGFCFYIHNNLNGSGEAAQRVAPRPVVSDRRQDLILDAFSQRQFAVSHSDVRAPLYHSLWGALRERRGGNERDLLGVQYTDMDFLSLENSSAMALSIFVRLWTSVSKAFIFSTKQVSAVSVDSPTFSYTPFTSLKSREESLHRAQMVASSTRASYWEDFTGAYVDPVMVNSDRSQLSPSTFVPVLSEQMTEVHPSVSTEGRLLTMAFFLAMRRVPNARQVVMTAGKPSGMAATANATAILK
ncbi:hypothetical protein F7725_012411 [Dissostichus mawsoni]|uniref:Uncharacterized protein n=1 Tax=Dissostichus mawsoni TaxID=36200 RepID=A0A7J5YPG3_DISMA|nr:hypothetical protein F7725_012411 [Dissostichus mawsoni]